jgi:RNA polymerase sigma-70 factor (ECF subfamily)
MKYSDEEIIEQVLAGKKELFGILVDRYQQPIYNLMLRKARNQEEAADLTQDAFVRAFDRLWSFQLDQRFFTWFYSLAVNLARDWQRKSRNRSSKHHILEQETLEQEDGNNQHVAIENKEKLSLLNHALSDLSDQTREILILRYRHGLPVREVAEVFKISESAVKMRVKRGLEQLRATMEKN